MHQEISSSLPRTRIKMKKEMKIRGPDALQGLLLEALPLGDKGGGG